MTLSGGNTFTVINVNSGAGTFGTLNVTGAGTLAGTYVPTFTTVSLAGGSSLTSTTNPLNFTNMRVLGQGASYTGTLNAAGKNLTFALPANLTPGQAMLNVTGDANIAGSTVSLTYQTVRPRGCLQITDFEPRARKTAPFAEGVYSDGTRPEQKGPFDEAIGQKTYLETAPSIAIGEKLTLLAATGTLNGTAANLTVQTANGDIYSLLVDNSQQLLALLDFIAPDTPFYERLKAYAEGRTATLAFINQGADLILNQGFGSALFATRGPGFTIGTFAAGSGGWSRYNTGSHVEVSGASMLAGVAVGNDVSLGRFTAGLFFEGGWGSYNSYNSFSNYASVDGDGDTSYYGGGILGRFDVTSGALSGLYVDASFRLGRADTDFSTNDIRYNGGKADFDSDSMYFGAHAGLGYQWSFSEKAMLDLSGKFIWTRQDGDSVSVHGDKVRFKDADSLRTRLGGRFNYAVNDYITPYAGAYWEHEFDGKQRGIVNSVDIGSPSLKGDTGVGELGLTIKPVKDSGFSMDLGVQGYTGVREGVTGSLQVKLEF